MSLDTASRSPITSPQRGVLVRTSKWLFVGLAIGIGLLIVAYATFPDDWQHNGPGCFWHRSWFDEVHCREFIGASSLQALYNALMLILVFGPLIFLVMIVDGSIFGTAFEKPELFILGLASCSLIALAMVWPITKLRTLLARPHR